MRKIAAILLMLVLPCAVVAQFISGQDFQRHEDFGAMKVKVSGWSDDSDSDYWAEMSNGGRVVETTTKQKPSRRGMRLGWTLDIPAGPPARSYLTVWEDSPTTDTDRAVKSWFIDVPAAAPTPAPDDQGLTKDDLVVIEYMRDSGDLASLGVTARKVKQVLATYRQRLGELIAEDEGRK